VIFCNYF